MAVEMATPAVVSFAPPASKEYRARLSEQELRGLAEVFDDVRADDRGRDVEL